MSKNNDNKKEAVEFLRQDTEITMMFQGNQSKALSSSNDTMYCDYFFVLAHSEHFYETTEEKFHKNGCGFTSMGYGFFF